MSGRRAEGRREAPTAAGVRKEGIARAGRMATAAKAAVLALVAAGGLALTACRQEAPDPSTRASSSFETEDTVLRALAGIPIEPVRGRTGPGGDTFYVALRTAEGGADHLRRQIGRETFPLGLRVRSPELTHYPCSSCHEGREVVPGGARNVESVHQNIRPVHPAETGADCATCHSQGDVSRLRLEIGGTTSLDHPYLLCAQCHNDQVNSWAMGAHGKRLVGWRGRRVVMNCTDCHSPHDPSTEQRVPYQGPEVPRSGGLEP